MLNSVVGGRSHRVNIVFENDLRKKNGHPFVEMMNDLRKKRSATCPSK